MRRTLVLLALAALALPATAGSSSSGSPELLRAPVVSPRGVGPVQLGDTVRSLHRRHLIGRVRPGCELAPEQRVARLRPPLNGFAVFSGPSPRVRSIMIRGGAETARGIGIGSTPSEARQAYPNADYDPPGTFEPFEAGFIWVNSGRSARMTFVVDADTQRISELNVPTPNFCE
jgi:hypothetical protein